MQRRGGRQVRGSRRSDGRPALSGDHRRRGGRCRYHQAHRSGFRRPRHPGKGECRHREELAEALGAAVSCSRPVVDAKWLEKSRQVGSSGKTVKPKVYLACGISGSFQHLAGIKGNPFIVAINKNPKAPIFQVADVGIVDDILEFLPELTNKVREMRQRRQQREAPTMITKKTLKLSLKSLKDFAKKRLPDEELIANWTSATNARWRSSGTCAARTSWAFNSCSFPKSSAAWAAAPSTCIASAKRWRGSIWASPRPCWPHSSAAIRSPSAPLRSRRRLG